MNKTWVVFDLDGTLLDVSARRIAAKALVEKVSHQVGQSKGEMLRSVIELPELLATDRVFQGARQLLEELSENEDIGIVLFTARQNRTLLLGQLEGLDLERFFDMVCNTGGEPKRNDFLPRQLRHGAIKIYVGDSYEDEIAALGLGARFWPVPESMSKGDSPDSILEENFFHNLRSEILA